MSPAVEILDDLTASRIAAGEVVERPASAVKELVENAIDAGARHITVTLQDGGKSRIEVADDGHGMDHDDAILSIQRHATSKIRSAEDLGAVVTLGFRGEALPSIASVSTMTITSRTGESDSGWRLVIVGGTLETVESIGCRPGTSVTVERLFYNTPARLKFLKTTGTELSRATEAVGLLAVAHPKIAFSILHNGNELWTTPGSGELLNALACVWGREMAKSAIPVDYRVFDLEIRGFIGAPDVSRAGRTHQVFIVNGRPIRNRALTHALEQAFRELTPEARYPVACLSIRIDPTQVDVNVHPSKLEIKFANERDMHAAITQAVSHALREFGIAPRLTGPTRSWGGSTSTQHTPTPEAVSAAFALFHPMADALPEPTSSPQLADEVSSSVIEPLVEQLKGFTVLGQVRNTYIVAATDTGVAFIDQHVAHERVLYERFMAARTERGIPSQRLVVPLTMSFGLAERGLIHRLEPELRKAGWEIDGFGGDTLIVRAAPALIRQGDHEAILRDMIDDLAHQSVARRLVVDRDQVTIAHACRMAVKAGDRLNVEEMNGLLDQLAATRNPHFCPHGRPAVVLVPFGDLDRRFRR